MSLQLVLVEPTKKSTKEEDRKLLTDYILLLKEIKRENVNKN